MLGKRVEHVIEEFYVARDGDRTAVERELEVDRRLFGGAGDNGPAHAILDQAEAPFGGIPLLSPFFERPRCSIGTQGMTGGPV
jgi:hypothetical protein